MSAIQGRLEAGGVGQCGTAAPNGTRAPPSGRRDRTLGVRTVAALPRRTAATMARITQLCRDRISNQPSALRGTREAAGVAQNGTAAPTIHRAPRSAGGIEPMLRLAHEK